MTPPNRNVLWAETLVDELAAAGVAAVCVSPGSRSTPLTVAVDAHDDLRTYSHLDERSAAFFALGRARRTGVPTALVCTSGTAAANYHPAVVEAAQARVPMIALTADRPPELRDSGANQTVDQEQLYADAVRWSRDLPEPEPTPRKLRRLRSDAARAVDEATGTPAGPVHLNCPFRKPLEPTAVPPDDPNGVPENWHQGDDLAAEGRAGPFRRRHDGTLRSPGGAERVAAALAAADRPLLVAGPRDPTAAPAAGLVDVAEAVGAPLLADPLSGLRFGEGVANAPVLGGYDAVLATDAAERWPTPDLVVRVGASPTSKPLRKYLARAPERDALVDPAGEPREAEFVASDLVVADPAPFAAALAERVDGSAGAAASWTDRWRAAEREHWALVDEASDGERWEGWVVGTALDAAPAPATVFLSNSMPVRDADRFARPRSAAVTALANRGASGIDGVVSTALGAGSATDDPLVLVLGDLAYYHDLNGLLALGRCGVDATVVLVNNDGGGIFHLLPIESFDPPFTAQFRTPHGLDFAATEDLYDLAFERVHPDAFRERYRESVDTAGTDVLEVNFDAGDSHDRRDDLTAELSERLRALED
jgi:2-succinyl-5-enolpyruvyl-6-hydroxy-3-cyclohexene-1-carboxylate synthase